MRRERNSYGKLIKGKEEEKFYIDEDINDANNKKKKL